MPNIVPQLDQLPAHLSWNEKLAYLAHQFLTMEQTGCPLTHRFEKGLYIRELRIPAETLIIGRIHRHGHVCQLLIGDVMLIHDEDHREGFHAPSQIMTQPGYQMVVYALTDTVAQTVHPNYSEERDIKKLEAEIFESQDKLIAHGAQINERLLYGKMLSDHGIDERVLLPLIEDESDQIPFPREYPVNVEKSVIHGKGLFATQVIASNAVIAPARIRGKRTPAGRFTNHGSQPNARMSPTPDGDIDVVSLNPIPAGSEILVDYRHALRVSHE
jgi:SET domain